jgi:hypothetical protein
MQTKFRNLPAAVVGAALILPFVLLVAISAPAQFLAKLGYANPVNGSIGALLGSNVSVGITLLVLFPVAAFLVNFVALIWSGFKNRDLTVRQFVMSNVASIIIMALGFGFALFVPLHDAIPCFLNGVSHGGFNNLLQLVRACRNA